MSERFNTRVLQMRIIQYLKGDRLTSPERFLGMADTTRRQVKDTARLNLDAGDRHYLSTNQRRIFREHFFHLKERRASCDASV